VLYLHHRWWVTALHTCTACLSVPAICHAYRTPPFDTLLHHLPLPRTTTLAAWTTFLLHLPGQIYNTTAYRDMVVITHFHAYCLVNISAVRCSHGRCLAPHYHTGVAVVYAGLGRRATTHMPAFTCSCYTRSLCGNTAAHRAPTAFGLYNATYDVTVTHITTCTYSAPPHALNAVQTHTPHITLPAHWMTGRRILPILTLPARHAHAAAIGRTPPLPGTFTHHTHTTMPSTPPVYTHMPLSLLPLMVDYLRYTAHCCAPLPCHTRYLPPPHPPHAIDTYSGIAYSGRIVQHYAVPTPHLPTFTTFCLRPALHHHLLVFYYRRRNHYTPYTCRLHACPCIPLCLPMNSCYPSSTPTIIPCYPTTLHCTAHPPPPRVTPFPPCAMDSCVDYPHTCPLPAVWSTPPV